MVEQSIDQRPTIARGVRRAGSGMHHHSSGLVDDGEVAVFIENIERNIFGYAANGRSLNILRDVEALPAAQLERNLRRSVVELNFIFANELLHSCPANVELRGEKAVETLSRSLSRHYDDAGKRLVHSRGRILEHPYEMPFIRR